MSKPQLIDLSAVEARDLIAKGEVTAEAYIDACLARIKAREPEVEAWVYIDPDHARAQARALDKQRASGAGIGPLHGLPVGIKDIIDTGDMPTQNGSELFKGHQPERDATCVAVLRAKGAVIMGKTVTTELANTTPNKTKNPHNPAHTPGGSSSGSAAAVGDRMIPLALGTQTGGSVIRPASFCGAYAMKPTLGLISRTGATLQSHTLDTIGVYGRSVADLALIGEALSEYDHADEVSFTRGRSMLSAALAEPLKGKPKLGFFRSPAWEAAEPAAAAALEDFVKGLGPAAEEIKIPALDGVIQHHTNVFSAENVGYYGPWLEARPEAFSPGLAERLRAAMKVPAGDYVRSLAARDKLYAAFAEKLATYSAVITLPSCGPAPKGLGSTGNAIFNAMWTYLGVPCVTLPLMTVGGMPCGVQLIGKRRDEGHLLRIARWVDEHAKARGK
ncbi:MAG: amidase [Proteobacteria bacterium]|nr:amidase [Pseudomonadota bacterium]